MDTELVKCECCGLKEECTLEYIAQVRAKFNGKWLCGLCSEAVSDEKKKRSGSGMAEAVDAHISFCQKYKSNNPAVRVADGMRQILRRRSGGTPSSSSSSSPKKYSRSSSDPQAFSESTHFV